MPGIFPYLTTFKTRLFFLTAGKMTWDFARVINFSATDSTVIVAPG
jgi:hypothetical protein